MTETRDHIDEILDHWHHERPDLDPSPIGVFGRIAQINRLLETRLALFLAPHQLTLGLFDVLAALRRLGFPYRSRPSELASTTMLTSGGMTVRLDQLEKLGLLKRISDPDDRRVMFAQLTNEGFELVDELITEHLDRERTMLASLAATERDQLARLLRSVGLSMAGTGPGAR